MLTERQKTFLAKRAERSKHWPKIGPVLIFSWIGFGIYFFVQSPALLSLPVVFGKIWNWEIWDDEVAFFTVLTPLLFAVIWVLVLGLLFNNANWVLNEKKLLGIINALQTPKKIAKNPLIAIVVWLAIVIYCFVFFFM